MEFDAAVRDQIALLDAGKPLEAFDRYFAPHGVMFDNDDVFARGKAECRAKQEPFIAAASSISGNIGRCSIDAGLGVCVFRNQSTFVGRDGEPVPIDGLHWQRWSQAQIVEERYYRGEMMIRRIAEGIFEHPGASLRFES